MTIGSDLGHDLDLEFSRSNIEFAISQPKKVRLPRNEKQTYRLNSRPQMWPMGLTLTITLTFEFWRLRVTLTFDHTQWPRPWIFMIKFWYSCISEWEGRLTLHKGGGSRSFMTMTMTIWWPRSGVWIYQIVTGVTSVVSVPSTHLIVTRFCSEQLRNGWASEITMQCKIKFCQFTQEKLYQAWHKMGLDWHPKLKWNVI